MQDLSTTRRLLGAVALGLLIALPAAAQAPAAAPSTAPPAIETARLDSVWVQPARSASAQVLARNESRLTAEVQGTLLRWTVDVGAQVRKGDLLAQIDPKDMELAQQRAQAARDAAQARLTLGEAQLTRARELVAQGFFSQEALAQRETEVALQRAEVANAEAQLQTARRQLSKTRIHAPFSGTVVQRLAQLGEPVTPGSVLYVLSQSHASELHANVTPQDVPSLQRAKQITFEPQGSGDKLPLRLLRVTATVQSSTRMQSARLAFAQADRAAPAGTTGLLHWNDPAPHVPATLIVKRGQTLGVFVREGNAIRFVALPHAQEGRAALVTLPGQTQLVVKGQATLQDGQKLD